MKNVFRFGVCVALLATSLASFAAEQTFSGEIADSSCATNVHSLTRSHKEMLKRKSMGKDNKDCAQFCVRHMGANYMLKTKDDVYHLSDQTAAEPLAGSKVTVKGTLDEATHTIAVSSIRAQ